MFSLSVEFMELAVMVSWSTWRPPPPCRSIRKKSEMSEEVTPPVTLTPPKERGTGSALFMSLLGSDSDTVDLTEG